MHVRLYCDIFAKQVFRSRSRSLPSTLSGIRRSSATESGREVFVFSVLEISPTSSYDTSSSSTSSLSTSSLWRWNASRRGWSTASDVPSRSTRRIIEHFLSSSGSRQRKFRNFTSSLKNVLPLSCISVL